MKSIYIPMMIWQALAFLRNRDEVFARLCGREDTPRRRKLLPGEIPLSGKLVGFDTAAAAVEAYRLDSKDELAVVEVQYRDATHEALAFQGLLRGTSLHNRTGARLWEVEPAGCAVLAGEARVVMECFPSVAPERPEPETHYEFGGGPLGNGGC